MRTKDVVLITGASSGLGRQFCHALAKEGYSVIAAARRRALLERLCDEIARSGGTAQPLVLDVMDIPAVSEVLDRAEADVGQITCLVNNAGGAISKKAVDMTPQDFDDVMGLNLKAPYFLCTELARRWMARGTKGRIVNVGSISDRKAIPGHTVYGTSKAAIARMTQQLAREWITKGICVNALAPGYIRTDINAEFFDSDRGRALAASFPRKRVGRPEDLDKAIVYLCAPDQGFLTGQVLALDDGQSL